MRSIFHLCTPTQLLDSRFPTSLSIVQTAAANNSTRVLRSPLSGCQYLRPKEYTGAMSFLSGRLIPPCEAHLFARTSAYGRKGEVYRPANPYDNATCEASSRQ